MDRCNVASRARNRFVIAIARAGAWVHRGCREAYHLVSSVAQEVDGLLRDHHR